MISYLYGCFGKRLKNRQIIAYQNVRGPSHTTKNRVSRVMGIRDQIRLNPVEQNKTFYLFRFLSIQYNSDINVLVKTILKVVVLNSNDLG